MKLTKIDAITLFVADPRISKEFYERVFEAQKLFQDDHSVAFTFDGAIVNLLALSAAPELISPASVAAEDRGNCRPDHHRGGRRGRGMHRARGQGRGAPQRPDGSAVGHSHGQLL